VTIEWMCGDVSLQRWLPPFLRRILLADSACFFSSTF
jgi:hypothetical protein